MASGVNDKQTVTFVIACLIVAVAGGLAGIGTVEAQENLDVSLDVPQGATTGEQVNLSTTVSIPDLPGDYEKELTVTFYSNGEQIGSETVTVADGETTEVETTHTFEEAGDKDIEAEATVALGGQEYTGSDTATLSVSEPQEQISFDGNLSLTVDAPDSPQVGEETTTTVESEIPSFTGAQEGELTLRLLVDGEEAASETITVTGGETTETDLTTVFDRSGETTVTVEGTLTVGEQSLTESTSRTVNVPEAPPETTTIEGAAFAVPESLEDELEAYRDDVSQDLQAQSFVLATQDELYVVFTRDEPTKGVASVEGAVLERNLSTENLTYGVIASTRTSFNTTGTEASVQEVAYNSEQYRLDLVRINAHYRRVATLTDPDSGENYTLSTTSGVLIDNPRSASTLFQNVGSKTRELSRNTSTEQIDTTLSNPSRPHLHTFSFETEFWTDAEATVDAIVLDPQSAAQQFIDEYDQTGIAHSEDGEPILYVVEEDFQPQQVDNVESIKSQSQSLDGEVVETEVRLYQEQISVQETLEHNTGCDDDLLEIQTPQGPVCVNVVQDNLLHGGVAWNSIPQSRDDALLVMGVSSLHQDSPEEFEEGRYRIEGEVVSTSRINESLPEGSVLVIYDIERLGDIDYEAVAEEARGIIETRTGELTTQLRQQVGEEGIEIATGRTTETIQSATPGEPATVSFSQSNRGSVSIQQARIYVSTQVENAQVNVAEVSSLPSGVSQPPGQSIRILNISSSIADGDFNNASFQLRISAAAIPDEAEVTVSRYHDGEWNTLNTNVVEETDNRIVLNVETPGFSYFAVGTQSTSDQTDSDDNQTDDTRTDSGDEETGGTPTENGTQTGEQTTDSQSGSEGNAATETSGAKGPGFTLLSVLTALMLFVGWRIRR
ncbi:PGF-pre-PGF domain-containing protein [Halomicroarcula sp. GCM10025324]|uniref:PGF-pre-PGF domain-containing protein n=1 Tax=Haloarcula TaxID=2237 RepID=UPI0023E7E0D9|nr:PGF-pre-PGF domain-containing protein [Halomicroarcula sp. ZS-22-S1]